MKNLELWDISVRSLQCFDKDTSIICHGHDEASASGEIFLCTHNLIVRNLDVNGQIKWEKDLSEFASPDNSPVNITFLTLTDSVCVGLANGELFNVNDAGNVCDLVGVCDSGLLAMEWRPDQELLSLVTKDFKMILMSCTFDPITEVNLLDDEFGEMEFINVGWGKKETQFHGSVGKQAAQIKTEVLTDPKAQNDSNVKITWRGDGSYYAVGFSIEGIRRFKVFDNFGHLQSFSEKQPGLEANLSWRPSGNVIATTQLLPDKYIVSFFEKNGLKHGEFDIKVTSTTRIEYVTWSSDSEILTLLCKDQATGTQLLLLYTTGNYHWYLKQVLKFDLEHKICKILWDNDFDVANNKTLHIILHNGQHYTYSWIGNINHSNGNNNNDKAIVAVIDANKVLATGFRQTVVPPPMAALDIELDSYVTSVHFAPSEQGDQGLDPNTFFACTADQSLVFYELTQKMPLKYRKTKTIQLDKFDFPFQYYNWSWVKPETIFCIHVNNGIHHLIEYALQNEKLVQIHNVPMPTGVTRLQPHPHDSNKLYMQLANGKIMEYTSGAINLLDVEFNVPCPKFNAISKGADLNFLGLSHKGNLFSNGDLIMNNVSSYFVTTDCLLITTFQHLLVCNELLTAGIDKLIEHQKIESEHIYKRNIERGAKLVIVVPNDTRTVFQMPRGNLEVIQPRPLSLKAIGEYLDSLRYEEAFDLMRKQRINLNLIYDHDPEKFIKNIDRFLECIQNVSWLNLFLSDLENIDVTKTMYLSSYASKARKEEDISNKIVTVCDLVRDHLSNRPDSNRKILPLLTTYVKKNSIVDLENALAIIKRLKLQESNEEKLPVGSDEALKYLLYMVDVNNLFDVTLGMYDFDLVLLVANKSQKDPKEFIPMLNELNEMEENYKKFSINKHLKRFGRAVVCLVQCGPKQHAELKTFVKYHSLYTEALALFTPDDEIYKQISEDFGLFLKLKKQFVEAAMVYEKAGNAEKAIDCYKEALEWELALQLANSWPKEQFKCLCWSLITELKNEKRHVEALTILEQFYKDYDEAISYAIECSHYRTALRLTSQYSKQHLRSEKLLPALLEDYQNLKELIELNWSTFIKHRQRLSIVRENKQKNPVDPLGYSYDNKDSDLYSDAGSTIASSSRGSTRSFRSSKNRRKHERKVASLKEGSQYEDVALVMALHTLVISSFEMRLQVKEVVTTLYWFDKNKEALLLQTLLEKLLKEMQDSFKVIWTHEFVLEATKASIAALDMPDGTNFIPQGIASLEPHIRIAPVIQDVKWKLEGLN